MNRKTYASFLALALLALIFLAGCSSSSGPPIVAVAGATSAPTATVTTTYGAPLTATNGDELCEQYEGFKRFVMWLTFGGCVTSS